MSTEELRKAVERLQLNVFDRVGDGHRDIELIKRALRDQEAEIARLQNVADANAELYQHELLRTRKAEALLRECHEALGRRTDPDDDMDLAFRITAHLGGEHD